MIGFEWNICGMVATLWLYCLPMESAAYAKDWGYETGMVHVEIRLWFWEWQQVILLKLGC